jgi:hypothetical protein
VTRRACAQVGEFAFVLLSLASQLSLISSRLSMLLLGITAISLLTTPLVLALTRRVLNPVTPAHMLPLVSPFFPRSPPTSRRVVLEVGREAWAGHAQRGDAGGRLTERSSRAAPAAEGLDQRSCVARRPSAARLVCRGHTRRLSVPRLLTRSLA